MECWADNVPARALTGSTLARVFEIVSSCDAAVGFFIANTGGSGRLSAGFPSAGFPSDFFPITRARNNGEPENNGESCSFKWLHRTTLQITEYITPRNTIFQHESCARAIYKPNNTMKHTPMLEQWALHILIKLDFNLQT